MNTGIFYWFGYRLPMPQRFKLIASTGFNNVMLWWGDQFSGEDGLKEKLPDLARSAGLFVENIHTDFENANSFWIDDATGQAVYERYMKDVEDCRTFNIPAMVVHLSSGDEQPRLPDNIGLERLKKIVGKAEKCDVNIAVENMRIIGPLDFVFEKIDSPKLTLCYDSGHENCLTKKVDVLKKHGDRLNCLHLHDNDGVTDQHMIPGEGTINWNELAKKLKDCNFNGSVTLEVYNDFPEKYKNYSAEQFLSRAYDRAKEIAGKITGSL